MTFKIFQGLKKKDYNNLFTLNSNRIRNNGWKMELKRYNSRFCGNIFTYKIGNVWNKLPADVVNSDTVDQFKKNLTRLYIILLKVILTSLWCLLGWTYPTLCWYTESPPPPSSLCCMQFSAAFTFKSSFTSNLHLAELGACLQRVFWPPARGGDSLGQYLPWGDTHTIQCTANVTKDRGQRSWQYTYWGQKWHQQRGRVPDHSHSTKWCQLTFDP